MTKPGARSRKYVAGDAVKATVLARDRPATSACAVCGADLRPPGYRGRPGKFCGDRCRWAYWTATRAGTLKRRARDRLHQAVHHGRVVKPDACSQCGEECIAEGHHEDYTRPLEVTWLCRTCHDLRHPRGGLSDALQILKNAGSRS